MQSSATKTRRTYVCLTLPRLAPTPISIALEARGARTQKAVAASGGCPDRSSKGTTTHGRPADIYSVLNVQRRGTLGVQLPTGGGDRPAPVAPRPSKNLLGKRPDHNDEQQGVVIRPEWTTPTGMLQMWGHALGDVPLWPTRNQPPATGGFDPALFVQRERHVAQGGGSQDMLLKAVGALLQRGSGGGASAMRPPQGMHRPPHIRQCHQCRYSGHGTESARRRLRHTHSRMGVKQHGHCSARHCRELIQDGWLSEVTDGREPNMKPFLRPS